MRAVALLDSAGAAVVKYRYDAWGKPISKTGDLASTLGTVQPFRYRAYAYDEETGMYYLRSRFYNPYLSRFICADSILEVQSLLMGTYTYCKNAPIMGMDQDGMYVSDADDVEALQGLLEDVLIESASAYNGNEALGGIVTTVIYGGAGLISSGLTLLIYSYFEVPAMVAAVGATMILGPMIFVAAFTANYYEEDFLDDGAANKSVSTPEQWKDIGEGSLLNYGTVMGNQIVKVDKTASNWADLANRLFAGRHINQPSRKSAGKVCYKKEPLKGIRFPRKAPAYLY